MAITFRAPGRWGGAAALIATLITASASAQKNENSTAADDLYRHGMSDFEAGDYAHACPALAESYRLDPLPGALFTVATCELKAGKTASAFKRFGEFISLVDSLAPSLQPQQQTRRGVAEQQRRDLSVDLPYIRVAVQGPSAIGAQIYLDDTLLPAESIGIELAVDPGEHVIEERRKGRARSVQRVTLAKGERKAVTVVLAEESPMPPRPAAALIHPSANSAHMLAYSIGGIGIAGLALGSVAGILALGQKGIVKGECEGTVCSVRGKDAADAGKSEGLVSTVGFGVGITGLAISAVMLLRSPQAAQSATNYHTPTVSVSPQRIVLTGAF